MVAAAGHQVVGALTGRRACWPRPGRGDRVSAGTGRVAGLVVRSRIRGCPHGRCDGEHPARRLAIGAGQSAPGRTPGRGYVPDGRRSGAGRGRPGLPKPFRAGAARSARGDHRGSRCRYPTEEVTSHLIAGVTLAAGPVLCLDHQILPGAVVAEVAGVLAAADVVGADPVGEADVGLGQPEDGGGLAGAAEIDAARGHVGVPGTLVELLHFELDTLPALVRGDGGVGVQQVTAVEEQVADSADASAAVIAAE